jgi:hypothetical protein
MSSRRETHLLLAAQLLLVLYEQLRLLRQPLQAAAGNIAQPRLQ